MKMDIVLLLKNRIMSLFYIFIKVMCKKLIHIYLLSEKYWVNGDIELSLGNTSSIWYFIEQVNYAKSGGVFL